MSADNWAICPRCLDRAKAERAAKFEAARIAYGNVEPEEYERLRSEAQVEIDPEQFRTFREDYEFWGAEDGKVGASYKGRCQTCDLSAGFEREKVFYTPEAVT